MASTFENKLEKIVSLCKRRGFVFQGSEIYGGFAGTFDYGPYGTALRKNIKEAWIRAMQDHENIALLDSSIFTSGTKSIRPPRIYICLIWI